MASLWLCGGATPESASANPAAPGGSLAETRGAGEALGRLQVAMVISGFICQTASVWAKARCGHRGTLLDVFPPPRFHLPSCRSPCVRIRFPEKPLPAPARRCLAASSPGSRIAPPQPSWLAGMLPAAGGAERHQPLLLFELGCWGSACSGFPALAAIYDGEIGQNQGCESSPAGRG